MGSTSNAAIARGLTREIAAELAVQSLQNSRRLLKSARILESHSDFAGGLALATTAGEEVGKFIIVVAFLLGGSNPEHVVSVSRQHHSKQALGFAAGQIVRDLLLTLKASPLRISADSPESVLGGILQVIPRINEALAPSLTALEDRAQSALGGDVELARQSALYVTLVYRDSTVLIENPSSISAAECREAIETVEPFIDVVDAPDGFIVLEGLSDTQSESGPADLASMLLRLFTADTGRHVLRRDATNDASCR